MHTKPQLLNAYTYVQPDGHPKAQAAPSAATTCLKPPHMCNIPACPQSC